MHALLLPRVSQVQRSVSYNSLTPHTAPKFIKATPTLFLPVTVSLHRGHLFTLPPHPSQVATCPHGNRTSSLLAQPHTRHSTTAEPLEDYIEGGREGRAGGRKEERGGERERGKEGFRNREGEGRWKKGGEGVS